jgi:hypothetical protein
LRNSCPWLITKTQIAESVTGIMPGYASGKGGPQIVDLQKVYEEPAKIMRLCRNTFGAMRQSSSSGNSS